MIALEMYNSSFLSATMAVGTSLVEDGINQNTWPHSVKYIKILSEVNGRYIHKSKKGQAMVNCKDELACIQ